jgi:hypothetical protein
VNFYRGGREERKIISGKVESRGKKIARDSQNYRRLKSAHCVLRLPRIVTISWAREFDVR